MNKLQIDLQAFKARLTPEQKQVMRKLYDDAEKGRMPINTTEFLERVLSNPDGMIRRLNKYIAERG